MSLCNPTAIAVDAADNLYIVDTNRLIRVDYATGLAWQLAGGYTAGYSGDGGAANAALLSGIGGVVLDGAGDIYVADTGNGVIRQITNTAAVLNFADTNIGSSSALMPPG